MQESSQGIDVRIGNTELAATLGLTTEPARSASANGNSVEPGWQYVRASLESGITAGFQMATANGPLCDEPMWGIAFEVLELPLPRSPCHEEHVPLGVNEDFCLVKRQGWRYKLA